MDLQPPGTPPDKPKVKEHKDSPIKLKCSNHIHFKQSKRRDKANALRIDVRRQAMLAESWAR